MTKRLRDISPASLLTQDGEVQAPYGSRFHLNIYHRLRQGRSDLTATAARAEMAPELLSLIRSAGTVSVQTGTANEGAGNA